MLKEASFNLLVFSPASLKVYLFVVVSSLVSYGFL